MLTDHDTVPGVGESDPPADRAMLALQYLTALAAVAAAGLLALVH